MKTMHVAIRSIGNSRGVVIPKPLLVQLGLDDATDAEMSVEGGALVLRKPAAPVRAGWADGAMMLAAQGDDSLAMGEFGNHGDSELSW